MADILAKNQDLTKIIRKAVDRIGENHTLARDSKGVEMSAQEVEKDRVEWRKTKVIEESLKAAAEEMAEKMVLENTIDKMVKENLQGQTPIGNKLKSVGAGFVDKQGTSDALTKFNKRQEMGEQKHDLYLIKKEDIPKDSHDCVTFKDMDDTRTGEGTYAFCKYGDELPIGNKTVGDYVTIEDCCKQADENTVNESTTNIIKKLVHKKLNRKINEASAKVPGYDAYEKAGKKSKKEADAYHKDTKKKFKKYDSFEGSENPDFPHQEMSKTNNDGQFQYYRNDDDAQEFIDDFGHPGLLDFDINNLNMDRLTKYLEGSNETGNAQTDKDGEALGNVVPSELGKKLKKSSERRKEKIAAEKASMTNLRGYSPDVQKVKQVKEEVKSDMDEMKKLWNYNKKTQ